MGWVDLRGKDLLSISDLSSEDIRLLISDAVDMKAAGWLSLLSGKTLAHLCQNTSIHIAHSQREESQHSQILVEPQNVKLCYPPFYPRLHYSFLHARVSRGC